MPCSIHLKWVHHETKSYLNVHLLLFAVAHFLEVLPLTVSVDLTLLHLEPENTRKFYVMKELRF